jgi:hypothetical protein
MCDDLQQSHNSHKHKYEIVQVYTVYKYIGNSYDHLINWIQLDFGHSNEDPPPYKKPGFSSKPLIVVITCDDDRPLLAPWTLQSAWKILMASLLQSICPMMFRLKILEFLSRLITYSGYTHPPGVLVEGMDPLVDFPGPRSPQSWRRCC